MNAAQATWIACCRLGNEPRNRVVVHLRPQLRPDRVLVEVRERLPTRERCAAVILLDEHGKPAEVHSA